MRVLVATTRNSNLWGAYILFASLAGLFLTCCEARKQILVVGSANADTFLPIQRLPTEGENIGLLEGRFPQVNCPGGKGCTQAVAAAKLGLDATTAFVGRFGKDAAGSMLKDTLQHAQVDISKSQTSEKIPSGQGYVFLAKSGSVSAIVSGGSNIHGWKDWESAWSNHQTETATIQEIDQLLEDVDCILLQREVPEYVNLLIASRAKQLGRKILVFLDIGGEERPISTEMMQLCDYLTPNESELLRLIKHMNSPIPTDQELLDDVTIETCCRYLQSQGARNILVTRGARGSTLVTEGAADSQQVIHQPAVRLPADAVVDETGAGDCYRAAFGIALVEGRSLEDCLQFASAAGSCAVEVVGACASTPSRHQVERRLADVAFQVPRGGSQNADSLNDFPFLIGSRLNSMKDRPELWNGNLKTPREFLDRQATVQGLTCVDFNYPQHFEGFWTVQEAKEALDKHGLKAGAVCLRYPSKFARGAMNHPDPKLRKEAIQITQDAAEAAQVLGCDEVVIWSAFDGYDYPFQVDYDRLWDQLVEAFQSICDKYPEMRFSLEFKPTDENTRFFTVPTTAAAVLLVDEIDRSNMGLTLDVGHMLMSGENPGQSIALVGRRKKLFGIQLNDGFTRLAAEDGLMFGSVHPSMALEIMYQLRKTGFDGHLYFDTFPQRTDPVKEAEYNIRQVKRFWTSARDICNEELQRVTKEYDAIGALEIVESALYKT